MFVRVLVVSDIHGQYDAFIRLMDYVKFNRAEDKLILLGDLIDRGPKSYQVVQWAISNKVIVIKGNHEQMLLEFLEDKLPNKDYCNSFVGGLATIQSYEGVSNSTFKKHVDFIASAPIIKTYNDKNIIFVHAGYNVDKDVYSQNINDSVWDDTKFYTGPGIKNKTVIFGHYNTNIIRAHRNERQFKEPRIWYDLRYQNKIGIDCGISNLNKTMACIDITNKLEYYVKVYSNNKVVKKIDTGISAY